MHQDLLRKIQALKNINQAQLLLIVNNNYFGYVTLIWLLLMV